eukprot:scaffold193195_cov30-Tisochrysis_lutea.AAC.1
MTERYRPPAAESSASNSLSDPAILDALPLRPVDLCRLGLVCRRLHEFLHENDANGIWQAAARRSWGVSSVDSWKKAAEYSSTVMEFDETIAFSSEVEPGCHATATLQLGLALPFRVAAVTGVIPITSERLRHASNFMEWSIKVCELPELRGIVMWIGVLFDGRGADMASGRPRQLRRCDCEGSAPHEAGCSMRRGTIRDALNPFRCTLRRSSSQRGFIQRFLDSNWQLAALSSTGWIWGAGIGGSLNPEMPTFGTGDVVRVSLDLQPGSRGTLSFAVNSGPWRVAVRQLFIPRLTPRPVYFYPVVHLTDVSRPGDADLPVEARVQAAMALE